jgi:hypothetical protein
LKSAIRSVPTMVVVKHVAPNRMTFNHGKGRAVSSTNKSVDRVKLLSMKGLDERLQRLQVFARLKSYGFSRRDVHLGTRAGVAPDPGLAGLYGKHTKAAQLNPIVRLKSILHAIEDSVDGLLSLRFADARSLDDLID